MLTARRAMTTTNDDDGYDDDDGDGDGTMGRNRIGNLFCVVWFAT